MKSDKKILFVSGVDFKEKSIQVIRKTPEAYAEAGWDVHYVVGRDNSSGGDYFYEKVFNPERLKVYRFMVPLGKLHGLVNNRVWKAFIFRIRTLLLIAGLTVNAWKVARRVGRFHVVYGYEIPGVLATRLLRFLGFARESVFITRFQGVLHVKEWLRTNQRLRTATNWEALAALKTKADLTIMTNDGSQGLDVLKKIKAPNNKTFFPVNGVDKPVLDQNVVAETKLRFYSENVFYCLSVSRLDPHKRIDRGIRIIDALVNKLQFNSIKYIVLGGGTDHAKLQALVDELQLAEHVTLVGPVKHANVQYHFHFADLLISMYTSSNVGNPLLEAIRNNKPVVTLNNGDTGTWITHKSNGLIYDVDDEKDLKAHDFLRIASDIKELLTNKTLLCSVKEKLKRTEEERLWTWRDRMDAEISEVTKLLKC